MILLHNIIEVLHLTDGDGGPMLLIVTPDGGGIGLAPIDGDRLRHPMAANGFGEEALGRVLVPLCREEEIDGLPGLIHGAIEIASLTFDLDVCLIHPPAQPHRPLAAVERRSTPVAMIH
jgi:hypothetical protein